MKGALINDDNEIQITPQYDGDGLIISGVVIGNIDYQRCRVIMELSKGEFKEAPSLGFGVERYLKTVTVHKKQQFITELKKELKSDGLNASVTIGDDLSQIDITL